MKVGTDGVLLGGWISEKLEVDRILDIGTGSGLIALMLAQKFPQSKIIGIEPDPASFHQATQNFENSPWKGNILAVESDLFHFCRGNNEPFDLIVSNPPFHEEMILSSDPGKISTRSTSALSFEELFECSSKMLSDTGYFAMIAPFRSEERLMQLSERNGLFLVRLTLVRGTISSPIKRVLLLFSKIETKSPSRDEIYLEISRHQFSKEYTELTNEYYLHL